MAPRCPPAKADAPAGLQEGPGAFLEPPWVQFSIRAAPGLEVWERNPSWAGKGVACPAGRWPGLAPRGLGQFSVTARTRAEVTRWPSQAESGHLDASLVFRPYRVLVAKT